MMQEASCAAIVGSPQVRGEDGDANVIYCKVGVLGVLEQSEHTAYIEVHESMLL